MNRKWLCIIVLLFLGLIFVACDNEINDKTKDTDSSLPLPIDDSPPIIDNSPTIIGSWTKTGGYILTFYNSGAVTSNNMGTGIYGNGTINLSVPLGNSGTGSYNLDGANLIIGGFVRVGATTFNSLNGEWVKME